MNDVNSTRQRVVSGMRPTGLLHLGHYHGVLKNWVELQHVHECLFFSADWHALTTHYEDPSKIKQSTFDMIVDWLSVGISPGSARIFVQSQVPEHAELHLLLSMMTPLPWLERVPSFKDQQEKLKEKDLATYGFLGYPLLQSADILIYRAGLVPVGADQVSHVELTREIARRFNNFYGREPDFEEKIARALKKVGKKSAKLFNTNRKNYLEKGDEESLKVARAMLSSQSNISVGDKERLYGHLEGVGKIILPEPHALLTKNSKMPGLDGQKMSKSYNNTIALRDSADDVAKKIKTMPTDPSRVRRNDPGNPDNCPVWEFHEIYSDSATKEWVQHGCKTAAIGCVDCKAKVTEPVNAELAPVRERAIDFVKDPGSVQSIIAEGNNEARELARDTLDEVRKVMGLNQ